MLGRRCYAWRYCSSWGLRRLISFTIGFPGLVARMERSVIRGQTRGFKGTAMWTAEPRITLRSIRATGPGYVHTTFLTDCDCGVPRAAWVRARTMTRLASSILKELCAYPLASRS